MKLKRGATRYCFLTKNFAFKVPSLYSYKLFLQGLLANMQEVEWSGVHPLLCPIKFSLPLGLLVVMPRVKTLQVGLTPEEFSNLLYWKDTTLPIENKKDSFGYLSDGRLVAVDYGS